MIVTYLCFDRWAGGGKACEGGGMIVWWMIVWCWFEVASKRECVDDVEWFGVLDTMLRLVFGSGGGGGGCRRK